jgi:hypothetical protein
VPSLDGRIVSMRSFGMADCGIKSRLEKSYGVEVPPDLVGRAAGGRTKQKSGEAGGLKRAA